MKFFAALLLVLHCAAASAQQIRTIPADAKVGTLRHVQEAIVEIDGVQARLSPGAQIRDPANRLVLPVAIPPGVTVKYKRDQAGLVSQVWMLTRREVAQLPRPPAPQPER